MLFNQFAEGRFSAIAASFNNHMKRCWAPFHSAQPVLAEDEFER